MTKREKLVLACEAVGWDVEGDEAVCPRCGARIRITCQAAITRHRFGRSFRTAREIEIDLAEQTREVERLSSVVSVLKHAIEQAKRGRPLAGYSNAKAELRYTFQSALTEARSAVKELERTLRDGCHLATMTEQRTLPFGDGGNRE